MKKALIVSFDLPKKGETSPSLSIASLIAYAKADIRYGSEFCIKHVSFNMSDDHDRPLSYFMGEILDNCIQCNTIVFSVYIWSEYLVVEILGKLRGMGYQGKIVLGGYQIIGQKETLNHDYPECDIFICGYGENSLTESIFMEKPARPVHLNRQPNFNELPSPYLSREIDVMHGERMVRLETKRGCPYQCSFCAHRDLAENRVYEINKSRIIEEIEWFNARKTRKVNILDPVFNAGNEYLLVLEEMLRMKFSSVISLQCRFEMIKGEKGNRFIALVEKLDAVLEFGIQTIFEEESRAINRPINPDYIRKVLRLLKERGIAYEISLIYGLPNQTVDSFKRSIDFALENGATKILAFPLMLLKGTPLYAQKRKWNLEEKALGNFRIPTVVSGNTFKEDDWLRMDEIAHRVAGEMSYVRI
uniref:Radical SAM superfamily enzyme YgiQ, UPF0313 family n=1 Tax=Candidatus Kentrum sp. DK TaxID=2126562 RepID=A0A450SE24_9GAMM|nr:MAG: Radical SAM superfamily enzyme YgiQ, UPF0313 family [Candidatus Kentron sp. DK]